MLKGGWNVQIHREATIPTKGTKEGRNPQTTSLIHSAEFVRLFVLFLVARCVATQLLEERQPRALDFLLGLLRNRGRGRGLNRKIRHLARGSADLGIGREAHVRGSTSLVMDEAAARAIGTCPRVREVAADLGLVLGMAKDRSELIIAMGELTLRAITTQASLAPAAAVLRLIQILMTKFGLNVTTCLSKLDRPLR